MSNTRHHAEWLSLVEVSGPFLSIPVLLETFPQGLEDLDTELGRNVRLAHEEWTDNQEARRSDPAIHHAWVKYVLHTVLEWPKDVLLEGPSLPDALKATIAEHGEVLRPDMALADPDTRKPRVLVQVLPAQQGLEKPLRD